MHSNWAITAKHGLMSQITSNKNNQPHNLTKTLNGTAQKNTSSQSTNAGTSRLENQHLIGASFMNFARCSQMRSTLSRNHCGPLKHQHLRALMQKAITMDNIKHALITK